MLKHRLCSLLILLSLSWSSVAAAQIRSATITGTVMDPQKAIVPGATVVITNEATNVSAEFVTTDAGLFTAPLLQAGTYTVTVTLSGFATFKRSGIAVGATETYARERRVDRQPARRDDQRHGRSAAAADRQIERLGRDQRGNDRGAPQHHAEPARLCVLSAGSRAARAGDQYRQYQLVWHRRRRPAPVVGGRHQRRPRLHQRHPARRPARHGRRLQRSRRRPEHRGPSGSPGHLEQLQRRVRPRPGRHLDEHEVGNQRVPRQWHLHVAR